jgi:hypothetical protein
MSYFYKILIGCIFITNILLGVLIAMVVVFAVGSDDMKITTENMYKLTKQMSQDTKDMKNHLIQSLPQTQIQNILSSTSNLLTFQQRYPNINSGFNALLTNFEQNPNSTIFKNIKEFTQYLTPELMNKTDVMIKAITTFTNSLTPELINKIDIMVEAITNFTNAGSLLENSLLENHEVKIKF